MCLLCVIIVEHHLRGVANDILDKRDGNEISVSVITDSPNDSNYGTCA